MRKKLPWILLASVGMVFLKASLIIAQQSAPAGSARITIQESGPIYVAGNVISPRALVDVGGLGWLVPALHYPMFDSRPLTTLMHRIIS